MVFGFGSQNVSDGFIRENRMTRYAAYATFRERKSLLLSTNQASNEGSQNDFKVGIPTYML